MVRYSARDSLPDKYYHTNILFAVCQSLIHSLTFFNQKRISNVPPFRNQFGFFSGLNQESVKFFLTRKFFPLYKS